MNAQQSKKILIIEDDFEFASFAQEKLSTCNLEVKVVHNFEHAKKELELFEYDGVLIDLFLKDEFKGHDLALIALKRNIKFIAILTSYDHDDPVAEKLFELGIKLFIPKRKFIKNHQVYLDTIFNFFAAKKKEDIFLTKYITQDKELIGDIKSISSSQLNNKPLLITGPTGSGKTDLANLLHEQSGLKGNFVNLNCSDFSKGLIDAELFGSTKGSYTGSHEDRIGRLELANDGTLFLDEIGNMPLSTQAKLLKAIEEKEFYPIGSRKKIKIDFRLISATKENLLQLIKTDKFRDDFYYRISAINLYIKPLKDRRNDIPLLINYFLEQLNFKIVIKKEAIDILQKYDWPGNIRELKNFVETLNLFNTPSVSAKDLPSHIQRNENLIEKENQYLLSSEAFEKCKQMGLTDFVMTVEREILIRTINENGGKLTPCATTLKIGKSTLYRINDSIERGKNEINLTQ